jgi:DNA replication protein DnaC
MQSVITGHCKNCGGEVGYINTGYAGLTIPIFCQCQREAQEQTKLQKQRRDLANRLDRLRRAYLSTLPREYHEATLDGYIVQPSLPDTERRSCVNALAVSRRYISEWEQNRKSGVGLIFIGNCGGGKTHLACAIGHEIVNLGYSVRYICVVDLLREIRTAPLNCLEDVIDSYKRCSMLILDDLGTEKSSDWVDEQLYAIVNGRTANYRPTIITTNLSNAEEWKRVQSKVIDRIGERCEKVMLKCDSYRKTKKGTRP